MTAIEGYPHIRAAHVRGNGRTLYTYTLDDADAQTLFPVGCVFKSFLSALMGIAIREGKIRGIEDPVLDYFNCDDIPDARWHRLRIFHALSKTTGIAWPGPKERTPEDMEAVLRLPFTGEPGEAFLYKPDPQIIVCLLEEVYQTDIISLFETKLASHFQDAAYDWDRDDIQGMRVNIDMLDELGQLMLNQGVLHGSVLFTQEYYHQAIRAYSAGGFPENTPYGLGWWTGDYAGIPYHYAAGFGGQILMVCPACGLCVSLLSDMDRPHPENRKLAEELLEEYR